ncbi:MAG: NAD(P)-dependent oxidoreductase [Proteobacteria bacterium]|nr:NAD(P)-dependent oxidoreductase [Pseudomonadota bacterium]MCP4921442.1 NAD(P)-dependent oxidoreductase [Pseudomonadota bacterium]
MQPRHGDLSGQRIAVTGATGFLGTHIVEELVERGADVVGVVRTPEKGAWMEPWGVELRRADLFEAEALREAVRGCDAVVANAALSVRGVDPPWEDYERANVGGCLNQLVAAAEAGVQRVVLISTVGVYRVRPFLRMDEDHDKLDTPGEARWSLSALTTNWKYMLSKRFGERQAWDLAAERGLDLTALRPGPIYGSRDHKFTPRYKAHLARAVVPAPTFKAPHVHARDVAVAVGGSLANPVSVGRAYNVAGTSVSPYEALCAMKEALGGGGLVLPIPLPVWVAYDDSAAERDLGFSSRPILEGMREAITA